MPVDAEDAVGLLVPTTYDDPREHLRLLSDAVNRATQGRVHTVVDVDLDVSPATSTTVSDLRVHADAAVLFHATDSAGAGDIASIYIVPADEQFVVHHPANASARTLRCVILG